MRAVFRHELSGYFTTPVGYVFLTMYALLSGLVFVFINIGQEMSASMNLLFSGMQLPLMLIAPLLTMRLFAEEGRKLSITLTGWRYALVPACGTM